MINVDLIFFNKKNVTFYEILDTLNLAHINTLRRMSCT